ncbi:hypothetical protein QBC46DRAFT_435613 [Diplogelasinospora grovesii]|uniref:Chromo domain-containing protein n=1 Tax=Diplogelasinospora grovesii TaxID=303347 RepID=A0AAN6S9P6_9PEZI|nr:hypothetical protein QBC46DRAFT_435613 [Diplogelasinospora grovesii]
MTRKRRSPSPDSPTTSNADPYFTVNAILKERRNRGRLEYFIDWADNPDTGKPYTPSWEPAENVTEAAIVAWEEEKRQRERNGNGKRNALDNGEDDTPRKKAKGPTTSPTSSDASSTGQEGRGTATVVKKGRLVLEIPAQPNFNREEYRRITLSQSPAQRGVHPPTSGGDEQEQARPEISQTTVPDSQGSPLLTSPFGGETPFLWEERLFPGQTPPWDEDNPASLARSVISHGQASRRSSTSPSLPGGRNPESILSGYSTRPSTRESLQERVETPNHLDSQAAHADSQEAHTDSQAAHAGPDIPSRQPDNSPQASELWFGIPESRQHTGQRDPHINFVRFQSQTWSGIENQDLLTQIHDVDLAFPQTQILTGGVSSGNSRLPLTGVSESISASGDPSAEGAIASGPLSFSAQVVPRTNSNRTQIRTQSPASQTQEAENDVIPDSVRKQGKETSALRVSSQSIGSGSAVHGEITSTSDTVGSVRRPLDGRASREFYASGSPTSRARSPHSPHNTRRSRKLATANMNGPAEQEVPLSAAEGPRRSPVFDRPEREPTGRSLVSESIQTHETGLGITLPSSPSLLHASSIIEAAHNLDEVAITHANPSDLWREPTPDIIPRSFDTGSAADPASTTAPAAVPLQAAQNLQPNLGMILQPHVKMEEMDMEYERLPATVAPSDLMASTDHNITHHSSADHASSVVDGLPAEDQHPYTGTSGGLLSHPLSQSEEPDEDRRHFVVTLPMLASSRVWYVTTMRENEATMKEFGRAFAGSPDATPDEALVAKMDTLFQRLLNHCDLPLMWDSVPKMDHLGMKKFVTGTNGKFLFTYEFLNGIRDLSKRVLILSQPGHVSDYLKALLSAEDLTYTVFGEAETKRNATDNLAVILATTRQDLSGIHGGDVDIVIVFDHDARSAVLPPSLNRNGIPPIVLSLLTTYSIEHIDSELAGYEVHGLERKNALNLILAGTWDLLESPDPGYPEPWEAAEIFGKFIRSPEDGIHYRPKDLPDRLFEVLNSLPLRSQETHGEDVQQGDVGSAEPASRKRRQLEDGATGIAKRPRIVDLRDSASRDRTPAVPMSDLLKSVLADHAPAPNASAELVEAPIQQLESMAAKINELEERLSAQAVARDAREERFLDLEKELKSYKKTVNTLHKRHTQAIKDRSDFDRRCKKALDAEAQAKKRLGASLADAESLKEANKLLEKKLADAQALLVDSSNPDVSALSRARIQLEDAEKQIKSTEKKLKLAQEETEYSRSAYQEASRAHSELENETKALKDQVSKLQRRADENQVKIQQIHRNNEVEIAWSKNDELKAQLRDRERELAFVKDKLKVLTEGRRETRQASVPRSPRASIISPRNGRSIRGGTADSTTTVAGAGAGNRGGRGASAAADAGGSRGTSPASNTPVGEYDGTSGGQGAGAGGPLPGMTFFNQPTGSNGGRWGHLRD